MSQVPGFFNIIENLHLQFHLGNTLERRAMNPFSSRLHTFGGIGCSFVCICIWANFDEDDPLPFTAAHLLQLPDLIWNTISPSQD